MLFSVFCGLHWSLVFLDMFVCILYIVFAFHGLFCFEFHCALHPIGWSAKCIGRFMRRDYQP